MKTKLRKKPQGGGGPSKTPKLPSLRRRAAMAAQQRTRSSRGSTRTAASRGMAQGGTLGAAASAMAAQKANAVRAEQARK